jgi:hypothetical protein
MSADRLKTALMGASIALILIASALTYRTISARDQVKQNRLGRCARDSAGRSPSRGVS